METLVRAHVLWFLKVALLSNVRIVHVTWRCRSGQFDNMFAEAKTLFVRNLTQSACCVHKIASC